MPSLSSSAVLTELERCLVVTCPSALSPATMESLRAQVLDRCGQRAFQAVVIDLSAIDLLDLTEWTWLRGFSGGVALMGSRAWLVGLRPSVIGALMTLNAPIDGMSFAMGVEDALMLSKAT